MLNDESNLKNIIFEMGIRDSCSCNNNIWITILYEMYEVIHNFQLIASSQTKTSLEIFVIL